MPEELNRYDKVPVDLPEEGSDSLWQCTKCGTFFREKLRAESCCDKVLCNRCHANPRATGNTYCMPCLHARAAERLQAKLDAAEEVDPDGMVTEDGERWWNDVDDYIDWCVGEEVEPDKYLFAGRKITFYISPEDVIADACERLFETCEEMGDPALVGVEEFSKAVEEFVAKNQHVSVWAIDYTKKVKVLDDIVELEDE